MNILKGRGGGNMSQWYGNTVCQICGRSAVLVGKYFYDAKTRQGPWALMCERCFCVNGVGTGLGKGQRYNSQTRKLEVE